MFFSRPLERCCQIFQKTHLDVVSKKQLKPRLIISQVISQTPARGGRGGRSRQGEYRNIEMSCGEGEDIRRKMKTKITAELGKDIFQYFSFRPSLVRYELCVSFFVWVNNFQEDSWLLLYSNKEEPFDLSTPLDSSNCAVMTPCKL